MRKYAKDTTVDMSRSRAEIERTLMRFGAERFMSGWDSDAAYVAFVYAGRAVRLTMPLPDKSEFQLTPHTGKRRTEASMLEAWETACRRKWRSLALLVKAKLVGCDDAIASFEQEFLPYTILPSGQTVADWLEPQIVNLLQTGDMPQRLLPGA